MDLIIDPYNNRTWPTFVVSYENKNPLMRWLWERECYMSGTFPPMRFAWEWEVVPFGTKVSMARFWIMDPELAMLAKLTFA
jgi:hypothetical protein